MSLQTRLFLFFITIVVLPLAIASLISQRIIVRELEARARDDLGQGNRAAMDLYERKAGQASDRVQLLVSDREFTRLLLGRRYLELQGLIGDRLGKDGTQIDYLVVADPQGRVLAQAISQAEFLPGVAPPTAEEIASEAGPPHRRLLVTRVAVAIRSGDPLVQVANVFGGYFLDKAFVQDLAATTGLDATVLIDQRAISSTLKAVLQSEQPIFLSVPQDLPRRQPFLKTRIAEETIYTIPAPLAEGIPVSEAALVMSTQERLILGLRRTVLFSMILLVFLAIVGSMLLGLLLSRVIARPLRKLAAGANAIAGGNYDQHIRVRSRDEVGQLARAFNEMAHRLSIHIAQLRDSREEVKRALTRFGEALRATHDEQTLLNVVLETSMDALRAQRGMLMSSTPDADELIFAAARGLEQDHLELRRGEGIAGFVAESGTPLRLPGDGEVPERAATEPEFRTALCVPIFSHERVAAVLSLYDKEEGMNFTENDLANLVSLAAQAGVALENILLHNEAQKLSITDGLTGVWNYRYFRMLYEQEIDRSVRFQRPFSLIVCDIDNFKSFNDTYGHQRGDSVLIELATRVKSAIRDVDVLARYGGEEFLLILPETDADGGLRTAEKIRQVVAGEPFGEEIPVTVSAGVAAFPIHGTDGTSLLAAADRAMYQAKALGKNRAVLCWLPESLQASGTG